MFQMPNQRPKVQPGLSTTDHHCKVNSYFIYCNKLLAYRGISDNSCLCCKCYAKIKTPLIQNQFELVESHFITIGFEYLLKCCINCDIEIVNQQPLRKCNLCTNKFSQFKFDSEAQALSLNDYKDLGILLIKGQFH